MPCESAESTNADNTLLENERLPTKFGWSTRSDEVGLTDIMKLMKVFSDASSLTTSDKNNNTSGTVLGMLGISTRNLHGVTV